MTERLKEMVTRYKDNGERVDEVLFQEVMKVIEQVRKLNKQTENTAALADYRINDLVYKNNRLQQELGFYAQHDNWWTYPVPGGYASAATVDNGRRARKELEESK